MDMRQFLREAHERREREHQTVMRVFALIVLTIIVAAIAMVIAKPNAALADEACHTQAELVERLKGAPAEAFAQEGAALQAAKDYNKDLAPEIKDAEGASITINRVTGHLVFFYFDANGCFTVWIGPAASQTYFNYLKAYRVDPGI